ncbi:fimbrial protein [Pseudomonas fontis]|uniref:Type 1 fimbrial protein n=1 Tax=Pseudomonas fontis TaxID=2942633 RepID=A0ABT5NU70_9PSED|nr:fimbrial protein [Pseudomonas fontis]MDD0977347.1 type 1 fimbrial protein [Pseudomonas fontis]MDD0991715.1 type 1 fimbrial protein [Pseudomonas fontis]
MKKSLFALTLGLAATSAFAAPDGRINFLGSVKSASCAIEIVNPENGSVGNLIQLGSVDSSALTTVGSVAGERAFQMRITPGTTCSVDPGKLDATVTFNSVYGGGGEHYGLKPTNNPAQSVVVAIKDRSNSYVKNGTASTIYVLDPTNPTLMDFTAMYLSTASSGAPVTAGSADADIEFTLAMN